MKKIILVFLGFFIFNMAQAQSIEPGEYIQGDGWGTLTVKKNKDKNIFDISSLGANFHSCTVDGEFDNKNIAELETMDGEPKCKITFTKKDKGILVDASDTCRYFCGARASFDGEYFVPEKGCKNKEVNNSRKLFKKLYGQKKYDEALAVLEPVLNNCSNTLFWSEIDWIRNDLAVTMAKVDRKEDCRKILEPLVEVASMNDDEIKNEYLPMEVDIHLSIAKAARTNLKLCK